MLKANNKNATTSSMLLNHASVHLCNACRFQKIKNQKKSCKVNKECQKVEVFFKTCITHQPLLLYERIIYFLKCVAVNT